MRSRGQGHKRKDGRWETEVSLLLPDGNKLRKSVYGNTQVEMQEEARKLLVKTGGKAPSPWTISDLVTLCETQRWIEPTLAAKTIEQYKWAKTRILASLSALVVEEFRPADAARFLRTLSKEAGISGRSVQIHRNVLSGMFRVAVEEGWRDTNPLREIETPVSAKPKRRGVPTEAQWRTLIDKETNAVLRDLWYCLGATGMRPYKEALPTHRSQLEYHRDLWWIRVTGSKTEAGEDRLVPLPDDLGGRLYECDGLLFPTSVGTAYLRSNIHRAFKDACERAGLPDFQVYSLRNLALTRWVRAKIPADVLKALAGHTKISVTLDVYARLSKDDIVTGVLGATAPSEVRQSISNYLDSNDTI